MSGMCMCGDAECPSCGAAQGTLAEEDLSDEALEGERVELNDPRFTLAEAEALRADLLANLGVPQRVDATDVEALKTMSAETESILRENAETRADLGLDTTPAGDTFDAETGEVLKDAPGWDKTTRTILNRDGLEWAGRRLREVEEALAENHRAAAAELKELEERLRKAKERHEKADAPLLASRAFFDAAIRAYAEGHRAELLKGLRTKSVSLPCGVTLGWKKTGGGLRLVEGEGAAGALKKLIAWADRPEMPQALLRRPDPEPALNSIKAYAKARNVIPPGMERAPEHEELNIKVGP